MITSNVIVKLSVSSYTKFRIRHNLCMFSRAILLNILYSLLLITILTIHVNGDRNSNSEAICAPFLTGQT